MATPSQMGDNSIPTRKSTTRPIVYCVMVVIVGVIIVSFLSQFLRNEVYRTPNKDKSADNLKQLFMLMTMYANNNSNCYPSMQPPGSTTNGGVRDLYPLYAVLTNKKKFLELLRPPGMGLIQFSVNPGPDEFDNQHIGYLYNSTVAPCSGHANDTGQWSNIPLMAERGASDGVLTKEEKPAYPDGANVLLANGYVRWLPLKGTNLVLGDIRLEDLKKLK